MYNETNEYLIKVNKEGKPRGNKTPPQKIMYQKKKMATTRKLFSSLQDDPTKSETSSH
jgi:TfoX/Sxy family transcriptional regulator of competence genes